MSRTLKVTSSLATLALVGAGLGAVATGTANAGSAAQPRSRVLAEGLIGPLSVAVADNGTRYVTQNFAGNLVRQVPGQEPKVIYANTDGFEVGAVSERDGRLRFALSKNQRRGTIMARSRNGNVFPIANIGAYEKKNNPDKKVAYGFRGLSDACAAQMPPDGPPAAYKGIVETHPYATELTADATYVADAAANAVFAIPRPGTIRTVAVLPPTPVKISGELAAEFGFPSCVAGKRYWFEAVPTDVEMGPGGNLFVTSLPGGPEDPRLGANGRVYRVNPRTGAVTKVVAGLVSATGLDVARNGDVYVAEMFRGRISKTKPGGSPRTVVEVPLPADVELAGGYVYATTNALPGEDEPPNGQLVRIGSGGRLPSTGGR